MSTNDDIYELQREVHNQLKTSIEKFSYYVIALSVSSLAFVIYLTKDDKIDFPKILLLFAVLFWALSIYCGFNFIKKQQIGLLISYTMYENLRNKFDYSKNDSQKIKEIDNKFKQKVEKVSEKSKKNYKYQLNFFFLAVTFYIIWHICEMYQNT